MAACAWTEKYMAPTILSKHKGSPLLYPCHKDAGDPLWEDPTIGSCISEQSRSIRITVIRSIPEKWQHASAAAGVAQAAAVVEEAAAEGTEAKAEAAESDAEEVRAEAQEAEA